jgi:hypothetical protein
MSNISLFIEIDTILAENLVKGIGSNQSKKYGSGCCGDQM